MLQMPFLDMVDLSGWLFFVAMNIPSWVYSDKHLYKMWTFLFCAVVIFLTFVEGGSEGMFSVSLITSLIFSSKRPE